MSKKFDIPKKCEVLLLCEGPSDAEFLRGIIRHMSGNGTLPELARETISVRSMGGKPNLRDHIAAVWQKVRNHSNFRILGIVLDADHAQAPPDGSDSVPEDTPAQRTLDLINEELRGVFGESEKLLGHMDIEPLTEEISVGVFVMSGDGESGELEDLLLKAAGDKHPEIMKCVKEFRACAAAAASPKTKKEAKKELQALVSMFPEYHPRLVSPQQGEVQAIIAGLPEPCRDLKQALTLGEGFIDFEHRAFKDLRGFLRKLAAA